MEISAGLTFQLSDGLFVWEPKWRIKLQNNPRAMVLTNDMEMEKSISVDNDGSRHRSSYSL